MKREDKNALSRQRILEAARQEFAAKGYDGASLTTLCAENGISKGIIYHYFKDKDELYLICIAECFDALAVQLRDAAALTQGSAQERLQRYFDTRLRFFAGNPVYLGLFVGAVLNPPPHLRAEIAKRRAPFDALSIALLTQLLSLGNLRAGLSIPAIVEDFRAYMDFFNMRFRQELSSGATPDVVLREHEQRICRQIDILLNGVLDK